MEQLEGCVKNRNGASVNVADDTADDSETAACTKAQQLYAPSWGPSSLVFVILDDVSRLPERRAERSGVSNFIFSEINKNYQIWCELHDSEECRKGHDGTMLVKLSYPILSYRLKEAKQNEMNLAPLPP